LPHRLLDLRVGAFPELFLEELETKLKRQLFSQEPGRIRIELDAEEVVGEVVDRVLDLARRHHVTVSGINSIGRQLEDAYLKLITEDEFSGFDRRTT